MIAAREVNATADLDPSAARAQQRIGEISKALEKVQTIGGGKVGMPTSGKPKRDVLKAAGISTSAANRCALVRE